MCRCGGGVWWKVSGVQGRETWCQDAEVWWRGGVEMSVRWAVEDEVWSRGGIVAMGSGGGVAAKRWVLVVARW